MTVPYNHNTGQMAINTTMTILFGFADAEWTVCGQYGQHLCTNHTLYSLTCIWVR